MNNKRIFERISAIMTIVVSSIMTVGYIMVLAMMDDLLADPDTAAIMGAFADGGRMAMTVTAAVSLVFFVASIVVSALYLRPNKKKGTAMGLGITQCVFNGLFCLLFAFSGAALYFAAVEVAAFVLTVLSLTARTEQPRSGGTTTGRVTYVGPRGSDPFGYGGKPDIDPFDGKPLSESMRPDPFAEAEKTTSSASLTLDEKLMELKRLRDSGVITEEQYRTAVQNAIERDLNGK